MGARLFAPSIAELDDSARMHYAAPSPSQNLA